MRKIHPKMSRPICLGQQKVYSLMTSVRRLDSSKDDKLCQRCYSALASVSIVSITDEDRTVRIIVDADLSCVAHCSSPARREDILIVFDQNGRKCTTVTAVTTASASQHHRHRHHQHRLRRCLRYDDHEGAASKEQLASSLRLQHIRLIVTAG